MAHDVFVSYSSKDKAVADTIVYSLEKKGIRCWYAPRDIMPGQSWAEAISDAIDRSRLFLVIFSENSNRSKQVLGEVNIAINDELIVLPFRIENMEPQGAMRLHLGPQHWLDAYDPSWEEHINQLVETVAINLGISLEALADIGKKEALGSQLSAETESADNVEKAPGPKTFNKRLLFGGAAVVIAGLAIWLAVPKVPTEEAIAEPTSTRAQSVTIEPTVGGAAELSLLPTYTPVSDAVSAPQVSEIDGMTMVYVPAGEFEMGSEDGESNAQPVHTVYLDAFWIDQTEVTNAQYKLCVDAEKCEIPDNTDYYESHSGFNHPVVDVSWYNAVDYCEWAGRTLPTEAQWEKAARGTDGRTYPWGEGIDCTVANYQGCGYSRTSSVASYGEQSVSPYGAYDMAGNAVEWVADWYGADYYLRSLEMNPTGPEEGSTRVLRGGSWFDLDESLRSTSRNPYGSPSMKKGYYGFRCVMLP